MRFVRPCIAILLLNWLPQAFGDWKKISPFTAFSVDVQVTATVQYDGKPYRLVSVEGLTTQQLFEAARNAFGDKWEERLTEDLYEVLEAAGKQPGETVKLVLLDAKTGKQFIVDRAPLNQENRDRVVRASRQNQERRAFQRPVTRDQSLRLLEDFETALAERWSYLPLSDVDLPQVVDMIARSIPEDGSTVGRIGIELRKVIASGIDGHARVRALTLPSEGYLPFRIEPIGDRFVAFKADRSGFLADGCPYLTSIDGLPIEDWRDAAAAFVAKGTRQLVNRRAMRDLNSIQYWRRHVGKQEREIVDVTVAGEDSTDIQSLRIRLSDMPPEQRDAWPDLPSRLIEENVGYLRLPEMDEAAVESILTWMPQFRETSGLIVDVRGNTGGWRDPLMVLHAYLVAKDHPPRVTNVAVYREFEEFDRDHLSARYMYRADDKRWSALERAAISAFREQFRPAWNPTEHGYSDWHYLVLRPGDPDQVFHYQRPVIVLMDAYCFSATDIFLAGLKGLPQVTLMGQTSGGGSAFSQTADLANGLIRIRLGSMVSFQTNGQLFDGNGVEPDVHIDANPEFLIGKSDIVLDRALQMIKDENDGGEAVN